MTAEYIAELSALLSGESVKHNEYGQFFMVNISAGLGVEVWKESVGAYETRTIMKEMTSMTCWAPPSLDLAVDLQVLRAEAAARS